MKAEEIELNLPSNLESIDKAVTEAVKFASELGFADDALFAIDLALREAVADEVVQETWIAVLHGLDGFEGRASLRTWIIRILMNVARGRVERERRHVPQPREEVQRGRRRDRDGSSLREGVAMGTVSMWRSVVKPFTERQIELRIAHCGPTYYDIWIRPASTCQPAWPQAPTACDRATRRRTPPRIRAAGR